MIQESALADLRDRESLFQLLRDQLNWPVDPDDTFTYDEPLPEGEGRPNVEVSRLVPFSGDDPFAVILAEFNQDFRRGALRKVLQAIRKKMRERAAYHGKTLEDLVFVCSLPGWSGVRFARFTEQEGRQPKLAVFGWDRATLGETRTLRELNLPALRLGRNLFDQPDWTAETIDRWRSAWDVERVTKLFFARYAEVFGDLENRLTAAIPDGEQRRMFTQRLFNRLLFIAFIQKKGWLRFQGRTDYLAALYQAALADGESFLNDRLYWAFFAGLGAHADLPYVQNQHELVERRGELPFLNGGLFEMEDGLDRHGAVALDNDAFADILHGPDALFNRFNFTITESTPLDVEVAVDPEMLGKVFEELVTGRHETGSYYTPKPVVSFMCREALKCYLETSLDDTPREAIEAFVESHDAAGLTKPEAVLEALRKVRVCDPACGSGAYLLGMLHELLDLRGALFATRRIDAGTNYDRKLEIIERSVYGVDQDPFAVNIARLRLWLSLAVDYDGPEPPPLPNLDFKVEVGDSLTGPAPNPQSQPDMIRQQLIEEFRDLKRRHFTAHGETKRALRKEIERVRAELAGHEAREGQLPGFDWQVEFAEVFLPEEPLTTIGGAFNFGYELTERPRPGGFDIVVANPPYVRADAQFLHIEAAEERQHAISQWKAFRHALRAQGDYQTLYEKWDLYIPFLERAYHVLADDGNFIFIIPDAYNSSKYALRSHEYLTAEATVRRIDFCSDVEIFNAGVRNTIIQIQRRKPAADHQTHRVRHRAPAVERFAGAAQSLDALPQTTAGAGLFRPASSTALGAGVDTVPLSMLCYISVGMVVHAHEGKAHLAFVAEDLISETQDRMHPKPYVEGKDLARWLARRIRYLEYGTHRAPVLFRRPTFDEMYDVPEKLLAMRICGASPVVSLDGDQIRCNHTVIVLVPWHYLAGVRNRSIAKTCQYQVDRATGDREVRERSSRSFDLRYVLGVMNSSLTREWLASRRKSATDVYPDDWKPLPIPAPSREVQAEVSALVDEARQAVGSDAEYSKVAAIESEIDARVAALYGL